MFFVYLFVCFFVCVFCVFFMCVFVILYLYFFSCHMSEMVLLTHDRISLGGFLCLSGLFYQQPVVYPTTFSADTTVSTYDLNDVFFFLFHFLSFHSFFLYFLVSFKRCCNHAHLFLKISYLDCMP